MGVSGLLGLLKSIQKPCNLKDFKGHTLAVDAYGWLHRGAVSSAVELALDKPTKKHVDFALHRVRMLLHFGVTPYLVFDGDNLPSKSETERDRAERRKESKRTGLELLSLGKTAQAYQELQKAVDITPKMARELIDELKTMGVRYVVAPYEADSQMAYLERKGLVDGVISEDSDLLVFGVKRLFTKLDQYGGCVMIRQADFCACREISLAGWSVADFRRMAILSGCDYLEGIPRMGLKTAHRLIRKYKTIDKVIRGAQLEFKLRIPSDYLDKFTQAENTFLYQWVFCPEMGCLINLTHPEHDGQLDGISYIGNYVEPNISKKVATGELDPTTKLPIITKLQAVNDFKQTPGQKFGWRVPKVQESDKHKPIDTFFKPKRTPLAELDPNLFTPSPTQQRLLEQVNGNAWSADHATNQSTSNQQRDHEPLHGPVLGRLTSSAPRPVKRQRLCQDDFNDSPLNETQAVRSKFFGSPLAQMPVPGKTMRGKAAKHMDVAIWSDDSIEDAMVELADPKTTPKPATKVSKKPKMAVFADSTPDTELSHGVNQADEASKTDSIEQIEESPFTAALLEQTRALRTEHKTRCPEILKEFKLEKACSSRGTELQDDVEETISSEQVISTKMDASEQTLVDHIPEKQDDKIDLSAALLTDHSAVEPLTEQPQTPKKAALKGSEDVLLIPDSVDSKRSVDIEHEDEDEDAEHRVPCSSPLAAHAGIVEDDPLTTNEINEPKVFDMGKFAFSA